MRTGFALIQNIFVVIACIVILAGSACLVFGFRPVIVMSGSMQPEIQTGSLCFYDAKADFSEIKEGDIIACRRIDTRIIHRAVRVTDGGIITKGDANKVRDKGKITETDFLGKASFWIPGLGKIAAFFKSISGMIVLGTFVVLMIILSVVLKKEE